MRTPKLHYLFGIFIAILCLSAVPLQSQAATKSKHKAEESTKERLVLMPLRVPEEDKNLTGAMETALVEGLQQKYEVFSGELVAKKAHEIFLKESRSTSHKECDETRCLQGIAESFQAELLAVASVTKQDGGYFLALSIRNIFDNKDIYSKSLPCKGCDSFSMVAKLKEIVGDGEASLTISPSKLANPTVTVEPAHKQQKSLAALPETRPSLVNLLGTDNSTNSNAPVFTLSQIDAARNAGFPDKKIAIRLGEITGRSDQVQSALKAGFSPTEIIGHLITLYPQNSASKSNEPSPKGHTLPIEVSQEKHESAMTLVKGIAMVRIPGKRYEIGKYDVTKAEWIAVMGSYQSDGRCYGDTCPVENVNWNEVQEFIKKLNAKTGKKYRLPTEAEWEYACYGGNKTEYCGGGNIDSVEWARVNQDKFPHSIGGKRVNKFGIYDMYDNVWQWMSDCWSADCTARVLRGGPKDISHPERSASYRSGFGLTYSDANIGFRLARTLP